MRTRVVAERIVTRKRHVGQIAHVRAEVTRIVVNVAARRRRRYQVRHEGPTWHCSGSKALEMDVRPASSIAVQADGGETASVGVGYGDAAQMALVKQVVEGIFAVAGRVPEVDGIAGQLRAHRIDIHHGELERHLHPGGDCRRRADGARPDIAAFQVHGGECVQVEPAAVFVPPAE